jgi:hypothetical protein
MLRSSDAPLVQNSSMWPGTSSADMRPLSAQTCAAGHMSAYGRSPGAPNSAAAVARGAARSLPHHSRPRPSAAVRRVAQLAERTGIDTADTHGYGAAAVPPVAPPRRRARQNCATPQRTASAAKRRQFGVLFRRRNARRSTAAGLGVPTAAGFPAAVAHPARWYGRTFLEEALSLQNPQVGGRYRSGRRCCGDSRPL